jgi:hypothetical protein
VPVTFNTLFEYTPVDHSSEDPAFTWSSELIDIKRFH